MAADQTEQTAATAPRFRACVSVQAARLLKAFRDFKKREAAGLAPFYASKLAALEDALLASRESLFSAGDGGAPIAELEQRTTRTAGLEREVRGRGDVLPVVLQLRWGVGRPDS
jgi:hypothetical protein